MRLSSSKTVLSGNDGCNLSTSVLTSSETLSLHTFGNIVLASSLFVPISDVVDSANAVSITSTGCESATTVPAGNVTDSDIMFTTRSGTSSSLSDGIKVPET